MVSEKRLLFISLSSIFLFFLFYSNTPSTSFFTTYLLVPTSSSSKSIIFASDSPLDSQNFGHFKDQDDIDDDINVISSSYYNIGNFGNLRVRNDENLKRFYHVERKEVRNGVESVQRIDIEVENVDGNGERWEVDVMYDNSVLIDDMMVKKKDECSSEKDEDGCNAMSDCVWCKSGNVFGKCFGKDGAKKLPSKIFKCDKKFAYGDNAVTYDLPLYSSRENEKVLKGKCSDVKDEDKCNARSSCSWCKSGDVFSRCFEGEDADKLPSRIFKCDKHSGEIAVEEDVIQKSNECSDEDDEDSCNANSGCTWCKSGKVFSKCFEQETADKLPPKIFKCDKNYLDVKVFNANVNPEPLTVDLMPQFFEEGLEGADTCLSLKDESKCNSDKDCVWCKSGAIPSKCYSKDLAKRLPAGVFKCDGGEEVTSVRGKNYLLDLTMNTLSSRVRSDLRFGARESKKLCDPNVGQAAGYFRLGQQDKHYFFWFFESRSNPSSDPLLLWMTGGPGCSSELALFVENGPCSVNEDGTDTKINPYSWNNKANLIFIDQPAGTGFSYGTHDRDEEAVGNDMNLFIREFLEKFPKFKDNKFFVFGESYAGHYVPATAYSIFQHNKQIDQLSQNTPDFKVKLTGIGIGNGLTDPEVQYKYYPEMAYNSTTAPPRVSYSTYKLMQAAVYPCIKAIQKCNQYSNDFVCLQAANFCNAALIEPYSLSGYNVYDMRIKCEVPGLCYDFSNIDKFLHKEDVLDYLGVDDEKRDWQSCDEGAHEDLMGDWMKNYQNLLPEMLESGIKILVYAGDVDYIVNFKGCGAWPFELEWKGKDKYSSAEEKTWSVDGKASGKLRKSDGLMFLQVYQAGHMVPMDKPKEALEMVNTFMEHGELF